MKILSVVLCSILASSQFVASDGLPKSMRDRIDDMLLMVHRMSFIADEIVDRLPPRANHKTVDPMPAQITPTVLNDAWNEVTLEWNRIPLAFGYEVTMITEEGEAPTVRLGRYDTKYTTTEIEPGTPYRIRVTPLMVRGRGEAYTTDYIFPECPSRCPKIYKPVCGNNGQTYSNICLMETAQCERGRGDRVSSDGLRKEYDGECDPCASVACDPPQCPVGFVLNERPMPGECCAGCVDECAMVQCDAIVCEPGFVTKNIEGECCPRCAPDVPRDCSDALVRGMTETGVYTILPDGMPSPVEVYCDMDTEDGGWTVILRRENSTVDFYRMYEEYVTGFGELNGAHWLGLEMMYRLGRQGNTRLLVTMTDRNGVTGTGTYANFQINDGADGYRLQHASEFFGQIGNALNYNRGYQFSAQDLDRDDDPRHCAQEFVGGWWYKPDMCTRANPMGEFLVPGEFELGKGIFWAPFRGKTQSMSFLEMKLRTA